MTRGDAGEFGIGFNYGGARTLGKQGVIPGSGLPDQVSKMRIRPVT